MQVIISVMKGIFYHFKLKKLIWFKTLNEEFYHLKMFHEWIFEFKMSTKYVSYPILQLGTLWNDLKLHSRPWHPPPPPSAAVFKNIFSIWRQLPNSAETCRTSLLIRNFSFEGRLISNFSILDLYVITFEVHLQGKHSFVCRSVWPHLSLLVWPP